MIIDIVTGKPVRRWQQRLAAELRDRGHRVRLVTGARSDKVGVAVAAALVVQRALLGPRPSLFDAMAPERAPDDDSGERADLAVILDGTIADAETVLVPKFADRTGEQALIEMIANGGPPAIRIEADQGGIGGDVVSATLAIEDRAILSRALHQILARLVTLIVQSVRRIEQAPHPVRRLRSETIVQTPSRPLAHMCRGVAQKLAGRLQGTRRGPDHWRIGLRRIGDGAALAACPWSGEAFDILPDDGCRFLADPMPFKHEENLYLFFEDLPYATRKGVIGVVEVGQGGAVSPSRTVLEQPAHLSYPYVLAHAGAIYMIPETSGAGCIQLFRADPFPDRWALDRVLVADVVAADATPIFHEGRWWLFATVSDDGGSSWDQLHLFHAPDLLGPFVPHADNPVLVDAGAARPAGAMWHEDGHLMRVAQDCRRGYGDGLAICRVDRLDEHGYAQTIVARFEPPDVAGAEGVHTFNRAGGFEVIDLRFSPVAPAGRRRWAAPRAPGHG